MAGNRGIRKTPKILTGVSAAALLSSLTACSPQAEQGAASDDSAMLDTPAPAHTGGEGEGEGAGEGESGGNGEFGIDPVAAAQDPVVYLSALEVIRAHYLAGIEALMAGDRAAGAEMFAHPISEIYIDLEAVVVALGAENFMDAMSDASAAPYDGRSDAEVRAAVTRVLDAIDAAEGFAPDSESSEAGIYSKVMAGLIERAALQYRFALAEPSAGEAYLDGVGFQRSAAGLGERYIEAIRTADTDTADAISAALVMLAEAYPGAQVPAGQLVDPADLLDASSAASAAAKSLN